MKTLKDFLFENKNGPKLGFPRSDDHEKWNSTEHKEFAKDIEESGYQVAVKHLNKPMKVYGSVHHHSFDDGVSMAKYFHRHDRGYNGSKYENTEFPKGSKVLHVQDHTGESVCLYGHHPKHGFIKVNSE